jgi:hypothetical protein
MGMGVEVPGTSKGGLTDPDQRLDIGVMFIESRGMEPLLLPPEWPDANEVTRELWAKYPSLASCTRSSA